MNFALKLILMIGLALVTFWSWANGWTIIFLISIILQIIISMVNID